MAYSLDFRLLAIDLVRIEGETQKEVAERLKVGVNTIKRWLKRETLKADKPGPRGSRTIDPERLKAEVAANPDAYLDELAEKLGSSSSTISYTLKKLKITRKKNHTIRRAK
jgi:excisionase family DNA binding protein